MAQHEVTNSGKEAVQQFFTGNATDYSNLFLAKQSGSNFGFRQRLKLACEMTSGISGRLLDCACGSGEITAAILSSERFTSATVVDLSPRMLEVAQERVGNDLKGLKIGHPEYISSDIFEFAAKPRTEQYDLILCLGLIAHTGRLDDLLVRLKAMLSPTGGLLLQSSLLDHGGAKIVRALTHKRYHRQHGYHISYFYHRDIVRAVEGAGLKPILARRFTFGFPFGDRLWAGLNYRLEQRMQNWAKLKGAEALYLLQNRTCES